VTDQSRSEAGELADDGWREEHSAVFMDYGRAFTPERERQHEIVRDLVASVAPCRNVVELCCGGGDLAKALLDRLPDARLLALDGSPAMLAQTRETCAGHAGRLDLRSFDLAETGWRALQPAPDAICSSLAIHHLDAGQKQRLFADLCAALRPGGVFVIADLVRPQTEAGWKIAAEDWRRAVAARSQAIYGDDRALRRFEDLRWNYFLWPDENPIDHPSSVAEHIEWLTAAGFDRVELHWMLAGQAILSAWKP
jgi:tRNA (cmo5U34)-methyltransferase